MSVALSSTLKVLVVFSALSISKYPCGMIRIEIKHGTKRKK
jgi:hypothetical protein